MSEPLARGGSGEMFDRIAARYDLLNRVLSFGMDGRWRRALVRALGRPLSQVLDVATGTADVALAAAAAHPEARVVGVDPSREMLAVGRTKVERRGLGARISLELGDCEALPFADARFDAAAISFGIRNVPDRAKGLRELARVVRPGGYVAVLELGEPEGLLGPFARFYVHKVVPRIGAALSGAREYHYLHESIARFPTPPEFMDLMRAAGLQDVSVKRFNFGGTNLFVGRRPAALPPMNP